MTVLLLSTALASSPLSLNSQEYVLDNGLRLIVHEDHRTPLFAAELRYRVGAADDPVPGMAHLIEHLMFEGSVSAPEAAYDRWLAAAGADNNAWTSHDAIAFTVVGPVNALALTLFLESDRMGWMTLDEEGLINQQAIVFNERALSRSAVGGLENAVVSKALYPPAHPYRHTVLGEPDPLAEVSEAVLTEFVNQWFHPSNAILVVGGAVSAPEVLRLAEQYFADVPQGEVPPRATVPPAPLSGEVRQVLYDAVDPTLLAVWPTVPSGHPDEAALDVLADVLELRLGGGRVHAAGWTGNRRLTGRLAVRLVHPTRSPRRLLRRLDAVVRDLQRAPVSTEELARIQRRWRVGYARSTEGLEDRVRLIASCAAERADPDCIEALLREREALTPADIQAAAQTYLGDGRLLLSQLDRSQRWRRPLRGSVVVP